MKAPLDLAYMGAKNDATKKNLQTGHLQVAHPHAAPQLTALRPQEYETLL